MIKLICLALVALGLLLLPVYQGISRLAKWLFIKAGLVKEAEKCER